MKLRIKMPDLSANEAEIKITQWLVEPGQHIKRGEPLLEVETDKAVMDVEAIATGVLIETCAAAGENVTVGQIIAVLEVPEIA